MKRFLTAAAIAFAVLAYHAEVHASCRIHTIYQDGRVLSCTTCCYGSMCNTSCF